MELSKPYKGKRKRKIKKMPFDMTSSMYLDYLNNKQLELKWLSGFIVECSKKFDNKCETHQSILNGITVSYTHLTLPTMELV